MHGTARVGGAQGPLTVGAVLAFFFPVVGAGGVKLVRILGMELQARHDGGLIGDRVVARLEAARHDVLGADHVVAPGVAEGGDLAAPDAGRAETAAEHAGTAENEGAVVVRHQHDLRGAVEEAVARHERAVVAVELAFENEADLEALAEIFGSAQTHTVRRRLRGLHLELGHVVHAGAVGVDVLIVEARVDEAVYLDVGGLGAESETCKSRGKCDGKLGLHEGISFLL